MKILTSLLLASGLIAWSQPTGQNTTAGRITRGTGTPTVGLCASAADVGKVYVRNNLNASTTPLYICSQTAATPTFAWVLSGSGEGGGSGCNPTGSAGVGQASDGAGACRDMAVTDDGTNFTFTEPIIAAGFTSSDTAHSGMDYLKGKTSGGKAWVVADVAGTASAIIMPTTGEGANKVLTIGASITCPTLPTGSPTTCYQGSWSTITSAFVDNSIALTGTDINTSNQVTVTHLASALPANQGGTGITSLGTGVATFLGTPSGANFNSMITSGGIPIVQNSKSAAYTTTLSDGGGEILHPTADNNARTFTIDSNANVAYAVGTTIVFINQINTVTIAITSDTLQLAGTATTGSRTLAAGGIATAIKVTSTLWFISGPGLT